MNSTPGPMKWYESLATNVTRVAASSPSLYVWAREFLKSLQLEKPDQEFHLFGFSRARKMPNYLLGSTSQLFPSAEPLRVQVNEMSAELFLSPVEKGVRTLQQELPMSVSFDVKTNGQTKRYDLSFYDAICFDTRETSLVLALVLTDVELADLFAPGDIAALDSLISAQAIPLFESFAYRSACAEKVEELNLVTKLLHSGAVGEISYSLPASSKSHGETAASPFQGAVTEDFFEYIVAQWKQSYQEINRAIDTSGSDLLPAMERQDRIIRNLSNISTLLQPNVKPQIEVVSMATLLDALRTAAKPCARVSNVILSQINQVEDQTVAVDVDALTKLMEKLLSYHFSHHQVCNCTITAQDADGAENDKFLSLQISDDGIVSTSGKKPANLEKIHGSQPMRMRYGGGILYLLSSLLLEKGGGIFRIKPVESGYCVELLLPRVFAK